MKVNKKRKGFVFLVSLIAMIIVFTMAVSMSRLSKENVVSINADDKKNADYYMALSGLQIIYGMLVQDNPLLSNESIISRTGPYRLAEDKIHHKEGYKYLHNLNVERSIRRGNPLVNDFANNVIREIKDSKGNVVGKYQICLELFCDPNMSGSDYGTADNQIDPSSIWCYKILSKGYSIEKDSINNKIAGQTLTMFVYVLTPGNPRIYDGDRDISEAI